MSKYEEHKVVAGTVESFHKDDGDGYVGLVLIVNGVRTAYRLDNPTGEIEEPSLGDDVILETEVATFSSCRIVRSEKHGNGLDG